MDSGGGEGDGGVAGSDNVAELAVGGAGGAAAAGSCAGGGADFLVVCLFFKDTKKPGYL